MLEVMKPQIAAGSKGVPTAYGEILFRAWKETVGGSKSNEIDMTEVIGTRFINFILLGRIHSAAFYVIVSRTYCFDSL